MARKYDLSVLFRVIDRATGPIRNVSRSLSRACRPVADLARRFKNLAKSAQEAGKKMKDIGKDLSMKLTLPLAAFGALAVRSATRFQASMNMVGAVTKATEKEFIELEKLAREMGSTTQFSASQSADGMKFLGMAGLKTNQIMSALPRTLELAASAQIELADAANIVTNIMSGYGIEAKGLAKVNDVLVNAFTGANVDLLQLGESFKMVGPIAKSAGLSLETTASVIGKLGSAGIQGTMAGTGLKRMLIGLQNPSKRAQTLMSELGVKIYELKDGQTVLKDFVDIVAEFERAGTTGAQAVEILGNFGGPVLTALLAQGSKELRIFRDELSEIGTSARVAKAQMKGLPGAFKLLASAFEAAQLSFVNSGLGKWIDFVVRKVASFLQKLSETNPKLLAFIAVIGMLVAAIGPLLIGIGLLVIAIGALTWPITLTIAAVMALGAAAAVLIAYWEPVKAFFLDLWNILESVGKKITGIMPSWLKKGLGFAAKGLMSPAASKAVAGISKSETDINIKLTADEGTNATVERVKKKKGDSSVNVATVGYVGAR